MKIKNFFFFSPKHNVPATEGDWNPHLHFKNSTESQFLSPWQPIKVHFCHRSLVRSRSLKRLRLEHSTEAEMQTDELPLISQEVQAPLTWYSEWFLWSKRCKRLCESVSRKWGDSYKRTQSPTASFFLWNRFLSMIFPCICKRTCQNSFHDILIGLKKKKCFVCGRNKQTIPKWNCNKNVS